MPEIKIQHVVSCSSEDKNNPAENLLKPEGTHKWKCAAAGEKHASVVLQFEKASQINLIDIGNEGSAFVEVLVGKSTAATDKDYEVILVASSFMSPLESRNGTNRTAVRMFGSDKLSKTVAGQKWDRVKIVCTQPFCKTSTFGLSFIKFHSPPDGKEEEKMGGQKKLGAFILKAEDKDDISVGSVFAHRKDKPEPPPLKGAAAVRAASKLAEESTPSSSTSKQVAKRASPPPSSRPSPAKRKHDVSSDEEEIPDKAPPKPSLQKQSTSVSSTASSLVGKDVVQPPVKRTKSEPTKSSPAKAFGKLMEQVVFVLSGFQNPYRGELREKALEMGAKYRPDWGRGCSHLICAFANTPKYNHVNGRGCIVKKEWIIDCYKQKKLLPWRKYRLGDAESPSESSEDEEEVVQRQPPKKQVSKNGGTPKAPVKKTPVKDRDLYGGSTDSSEDTEDDIRRAKEKLAKQAEMAKTASKPSDDPYGSSTDEDEPEPTKPSTSKTEDGSDSGLPDLPDFFSDKVFLFYGDFPPAQRRILTRYIAAYDGTVSEYMSDKVNYVITVSTWDDNFEEALEENPDLVFVKPKWIEVCHEKNKLIPYQAYIVVPS